MALLHGSLQGYEGAIRQSGVGLRINGHAEFVRAVYETVMRHGNNR